MSSGVFARLRKLERALINTTSALLSLPSPLTMNAAPRPSTLAHTPHVNLLAKSGHPIPTVQQLSIPVHDDYGGHVSGILHLPVTAPTSTNPSPIRTAALLLSGAGGGVAGPSAVYLSLADKLAALDHGIPALRLDYRRPARTTSCVEDARSAMEHLNREHGISRFVLVGWSFGGAVVFSLADADMRVVGCATVASQTADTAGIRRLAPRPVLLLHGTDDHTLSPRCSEQLYEVYGSAKGSRRLRLFEGDDHALTGHTEEAEKELLDFIVKCAGDEAGAREEQILRAPLVQSEERVPLMKVGGDLRGGEQVR